LHCAETVFLYPYDYYADLEPYYNNERNAIGCRNYNQAYPQTQLVECAGKSVSLTDAGSLFSKKALCLLVMLRQET